MFGISELKFSVFQIINYKEEPTPLVIFSYPTFLVFPERRFRPLHYSLTFPFSQNFSSTFHSVEVSHGSDRKEAG